MHHDQQMDQDDICKIMDEENQLKEAYGASEDMATREGLLKVSMR